ncbi:MAG: hypothetical protein ACLTE2_02390 [Eubacteriales bacterium]
MAAPYTTNETQATEIKTWILERRKENTTPKAILPKLAADSEAIINFSTDAITVGEKTYQAKCILQSYCRFNCRYANDHFLHLCTTHRS